MNKLSNGEDLRADRGPLLECAVLVVLGLVAFQLATLYPSSTAPQPGYSAWHEKDWFFWYNAHQLYRRDPERLSESEFEDVRQWCQCVRLVERYVDQGPNSLTDDECQRVVETLANLCPNLEEHVYFFPVYEACRRHLAGTVAHASHRDAL